MSDFRTLLDIINENSDDREPQAGDFVEIELGDTLLETYIEDVTEDGVIIKVDETALKLMIDAKKELMESKPGLWANIHAKRERIKHGSGEKMRKPGSKGAPSAQDFKDAAKEGYEGVAEGVANMHSDELLNTVRGAIRKAIKETGDQSLSKIFVCLRSARPASEALKNITSPISLEAVESALQEVGIDFDDLLNFINKQAEKYGKQGVTEGHEDDEELCHMCSGTGEGRHESETCGHCHGTGYEPTEDQDWYADWSPEEENRNRYDEAKYQGRNVPLNKPMAGDVKKSKVYVKKPNGKVVKVNFGDKNMRIKKSNPNRRKSFRARHNCENPGPKWKARYWSCRAW